MASIRIKGKIKLNFKRKAFQNYILDEVCKQLTAKLKSIKSEFKRFVKELVYEIIVLCQDASNLRKFGIAQWDLGIPFGTANDFIDAVAKQTADSILIRYGRLRRIGNKIGGRIGIFCVKSDFADVLALPQAEITTEKGEQLPILLWILTMGENPIPQTSGYKVFHKRGTGRSGGATMEPTTNASEFFKIDSSYSGTETDNWLIRAFEEKQNYFKGQIGEFLNRRVFK